MKRFWDKVAKAGEDECWEWTAGKDPAGYGAFKAEKKKVNAHRFSYEIAHGAIPDGMMICHHCDNPGCVNPKHLFLGTRSDNMLDAYKKGRLTQAFKKGRRASHLDDHPHGFTNTLTYDDVLEIRRILDSGADITHAKLAKKYGVHRTTIGRVASRKRWHGVENEPLKKAA